jgi:hypothetical protein
MKKKYSAPEMEDLELDEPIVLSESNQSTTTEGGCPTNTSCGPGDV